MRLLELGDYVSAAYCGKMLSRWGAEVIKVEFPDGDKARCFGPFKDGIPHPETSALFLSLNGGKKSVTLNPLAKAGARLLARLADQCEIVVCNLKPDIVRQLDLAGYASRHPEKVVVSLTQFGLSGPYSHFESTVGVALAMGGYMHLSGDAGREPLAIPGWYPEYQAGLHACVGALAAWLGRNTHPVGGLVEVSTMETLCALHQFTTVMYTHNQFVRTRNGGRWARNHPTCLLPCKDGWVGFSISTGAFWENFTKMTGHPELFADPRFQGRWQRLEHADELDAIVRPWLLSQTAADIFVQGQETWRVPVGAAMSVAEVLEDRHLRAREFWQEVGHPVAGTLKYPSSSFRQAGVAPSERRAPLLGEHNEEIYGSLLGLSSEEQTRLRQMGVI